MRRRVNVYEHCVLVVKRLLEGWVLAYRYVYLPRSGHQALKVEMISPRGGRSEPMSAAINKLERLGIIERKEEGATHGRYELKRAAADNPAA